MIPADARQYWPKLRHHQGYIACLVVGRQYGRVIMPKGKITVHDATAPPTPTVWPAAIDYARRHPGRVLTIVLALHLLVWTLLPLLLSPNLQLDLVEGLALGKEWQLGYWKHPPLPWWMDDLAFRLTGSIDVVYLLGPLTIIACLAGVWLLARAVVGPIEALFATLALEGIHFYNFSAVKFGHDQLQLPFWVFTSLFFYRAIVHGRLLNWVLAGVFLAGAFWSKYAAVVLAAPLGLFLIFDPVARRTWRTPGPYVMALFFLVVIAPNVWWLVTNDFLPFRYADERAKVVGHWYDYFVFLVEWAGGQTLTLLPVAALLGVIYWRGTTHNLPATTGIAAFNRRYVTLLALGPFLLTTIISVAAGRLAITMWGYPFWSFAPLAVVLWFGPITVGANQRRLAACLFGIFLMMPLAYLTAEIVEPLLRDRGKATQFPGPTVAAHVTRAWRETYGTPLAYVGGDEFAANNVAVYSTDRPHVVPHGDSNLAPWVSADDLARRGTVLIWEANLLISQTIETARSKHERIDIQPVLVLPRLSQGLTQRPARPATIYFGFIAPRP